MHIVELLSLLDCW